MPSADRMLDPLVQAQCSLAVQLRRVAGPVVGRPVELAAIRDELRAGRTRFTAVALEGEPGIGKTRLLVAASEIAAELDTTAVAVTADEEIRGPFLLARSLLAAPSLREAIAGTSAERAVERAADAISGRAQEGLNSLPSDDRLLRTYDLAAVALAAIAAQRPLALLLDDLQWADDDSLRLLRYVVRSIPDSPIHLLLAIRPEEIATVAEAVNLIADMDRTGVLRRLRVARFTQGETAELLEQVLAGPVDPASAAAMHAQAEGVPFIVEEIARTYRDAGLVQRSGETWGLTKHAERLVPSAVRTLIARRAKRLPAETRAAMADAAPLGRSFSLRDLRAVRIQLGEDHADLADLADALAPATAAGLLLEHGAGGPADHTFSHEQVRVFAAADLSHARRRAIHAAIVDLLAGDGDPAPESLAMLARHALEAGDERRAAAFSIGAARNALDANAPEEALRVVEQALPGAAGTSERRALLTARDDAYAALGRANDRLHGLAELAALASALGDAHLELEVMLRRAAALRLGHDEDAAAELARRVRDLAARRGDRVSEIAASLELGQARLKTPVGEAFTVITSEVDLEGAEEAYQHAMDAAAETGDEASEAAAARELGVILTSRVRDWFIEQVQSGAVIQFSRRLAQGETVDEMLPTFPVAPLVARADGLFTRALDIFQRRGDRRGVMSTIIATAFVKYAPVIHLTSSARHIEEIRRVTNRMNSLITESERAQVELQMLYGVHVYARAKVVPDLTISRGAEAHRAARISGDRSLEFLAAGGMVLAHLEMGELTEADQWLERAASVATSEPTPTRARLVETWRGLARSAAGDARGMRLHLERALQLAGERGGAAAVCETLAVLARHAAIHGAPPGDPELLATAERAAQEAKRLLATLPGHPPWGAQADGALVDVALARGDLPAAVAAANSAMAALQSAQHEDADLEVLLPAARGILAGGEPEAQMAIRDWLQTLLAGIAQRTLDEDLRVRWLRGPTGRELARLAGPLEGMRLEPAAARRSSVLATLDEQDARMLQLLTQGSTDREIAETMGIGEDVVSRRLGELFTKIGASSRAEATSFAFRGSLV